VEEGSLSRTLAFIVDTATLKKSGPMPRRRRRRGEEKKRRHGRLHIGANGVSSPPEKWMKK